MPTFIQSSFSRGEISPGLFGRVDASIYQIALRTALNFLIHIYGGASNRPGLLFVGPARYHDRTARLIPFQFKTTDTYMLEFGHQYMRPIRNDAHVVETAVNITGATQADPVVITANSHGYSNGDEVYLTGIGGMTELNGRRFLVANKTTNTFELTDQVTGLDIDGTGYTAYTSGGTVARVYQITTPYDEDDLAQVKFVQSADVMTFTHPSYQVYELTRTDHDAWTLTLVPFKPEQVEPESVTATQNGTTGSTEYRYRVTAINEETEEESLPGLNSTSKTITGATAASPVVITAASHGFLDGEQVEINGIVGMTELNGRRFTVDNKDTNTFELKDEDGSSYTAYSSGGTANLTFVKVTDGNASLSSTNNISLSWGETTDAQKYAVYREDNGLYGLIGETEHTSYTDDGDTPDLAESPPRWREPFRGTGNYPAAVGYFEQRLAMGGSTNKPDTTEYSQTGNHYNYTAAIPANPDDAFIVTLNSQEVNAIRHYVPANDLIILTSGEEWRVRSGEDSGFSLETIRQKPQSRWGSGHQRPVINGSVILYVQENNSVVRSFGYELSIDGYTGTDMTKLANHIFRHHQIVDWAFSRSPDPIIFGVRSDGLGTAFTFSQEDETVAWTRLKTKGWFEAVAVVRPTSTAIDEAPYYLVRRKIGGQTVRYIERMHDRRFLEVQDCFFVDAGSSYDSPIAITDVALTSPVQITAASHGFSDGDEIDISGIVWEPSEDDYGNEVQPEQLNGYRYTVAGSATNTFVLKDEDGADVDGTAFSTYYEGGYARKAVSALTGLNHLNGTGRVALCDGDVVEDLEIVDGAVTLPRKYSRVHIGLPYTCDLETLNIESQRAGTLQGKKVHISEVTVRFERSRGLWIGPHSGALDEMKQREFEAYGEPTNLLTGDKRITIPPQWNSNGRMFMRQRDPLPTSILAVVPYLELEDDEG